MLRAHRTAVKLGLCAWQLLADVSSVFDGYDGKDSHTSNGDMEGPLQEYIIPSINVFRKDITEKRIKAVTSMVKDAREMYKWEWYTLLIKRRACLGFQRNSLLIYAISHSQGLLVYAVPRDCLENLFLCDSYVRLNTINKEIN